MAARNVDKLLSNYMNVSATKTDIQAAVEQYRGLGYSKKNFVFNDGSSRDLVNLNGTIPIVYKGSTYHIPVCIWLMDTHPNNAPICFVTPTPDMGIRVSMYVDCNGKIYLPYLHEWQPNTSDLVTLIQVMAVTFGDSPPVYKNPANAGPPKPSYPKQTYMPQPGVGGSPGNAYMPYPTAGGAGTPASYMPYPGANYGAAGNFPPYPVAGSGYPHPSGAQSAGGPGYPMPQNNGYNPVSQTGTITEEHIRASLVSAVEDKLRRRVQERVNQCQAEIETLQRIKLELEDGRGKIADRIARMEHEQSDMQVIIVVLQDKQAALDKSLNDAEKLNDFDVDEAVTTTAPLYKQLLNAYAEEAATEDANYYMGEALRNGVIDLDVFLKHIRQLSRKQFMLRALMQKCRQTAGLAC